MSSTLGMREVELEYLDAAIQAASNGAGPPPLDVRLSHVPAEILAALRVLIDKHGTPITAGMLRAALAGNEAALKLLPEVITAGGVVAALPSYVVELHAHDRRRRWWYSLKEALAKVAEGDIDACVQTLVEGIASDSVPDAARAPDPDVHAFLAEDELYPEDVIAKVLRRTERLIVTGKEGHGKSTFLRQLAVQTASGHHPFKDERMPPRRVLLVDLENGRDHVRRKIRSLVISAGDVEPGALVPIIRPQGIDLAGTKDAKWLIERVDANRPDLLVIGPHYKLQDVDPNEEQPARQVIAVFDEIRERFGCAVILEAHTPHDGKTIRPYGASVWKRWPEFGFLLEEFGGIKWWRTPREENRAWPRCLVRGGAWPWTSRVEEIPQDVELEETIAACIDAGIVTLRQVRDAVRAEGVSAPNASIDATFRRLRALGQ